LKKSGYQPIRWTVPGLRRLLRFNTPEASEYFKENSPYLRQMLEDLSGLLKQLIEGRQPPCDGIKYKLPCGHGAQYEGAELRTHLFYVLSRYYDCAARRFLESGKGESPPGMKTEDYQYLMRLIEVNKCYDPPEGCGAYILFNYILCMISLSASRRFLDASSSMHRVHTQLEAVAYGAMQDVLREGRRTRDKNLAAAASRLLDGALTYAKKQWAESPGINRKHRLGRYSAIALPDLDLLARREESMVRKLGEKNVESAFESQLSLIMQSLGWYVVLTRKGQRTVDLICISSDPKARHTILLEAKSTAHSYSLPRRDYRALAEYMAEIGRSLPSLPPLSLTIVVSHTPGKLLGGKLRSLGDSSHVPCRFLSAQQLADLREQLAGPLALDTFVRALRTASEIVTDDDIQRLLKAVYSEQEAHEKFVESMLSCRGVIGEGLAWVDEHDHGEPDRSKDAPTRRCS